MINWDWTFLGRVNAWQTIITLSVLIIALFIVARFAIRFWPWLRKTINLFDALGKLPKFITDTGQFIARTDKSVARIQHEVEYNNGSSVKDAIARVERGVFDLHTKVDGQKVALDAEDARLRKELDDTKPHTPVRKPRQPKEKL